MNILLMALRIPDKAWQVCVFVALFVASERGHGQGTQTARIDAYVSALAADTQFSGALLVARGNAVLIDKAWGKADFRSSQLNTTKTLFPVASLTKPMSGIIARTLAARGALSMDGTIDSWLPDLPAANRITVAQLLAHRAGIPHRVTTLAEEQASQTAESMVRLVSKAPRVGDPGAQRVYSSAGYSVLARVLERAAGKTYAELLHEIVLEPAGAARALDATEPSLARVARSRGHQWTPGGPLASGEKQLSFLVGAGSVWATPRDLFAIVRHIVGGGYAGAGGARAEDGTIEWTGFSNGASAWVLYRPATDVTMVLVSNLLTGAQDMIMRDVPRLLAGESVVAPRVARPAFASMSEGRRTALAGPYLYFGNRQQLEFVGPGAAILGGEYMLLATSDTTFWAPQNYTEYLVDSDSLGVRALRLNAPNGFSITRVR